MIKNKKRINILIVCIALIIIVAFIGLMANFRKDLKGSGYIPPANIKTENIPLNEITTYEESIENGKVEIDGIYYDIHNIYEMLNIYNSDGDVVETVYINDDSKARIEFIYKNNQIIKEKRYSNDEFASTTYYRYENDLLLEQTTVDKSGLKTRIEYSYGAKTRKLTHYNSDNDISFIATEYLDDDGNIIKGVITTEDGEVTDTTTMYYDNDLLVKSIRKRDGGAINTFNIEYNNVGDKIKEYSILSHQKDDFLMVNLYDIEYNENLLPKIITIYQVHSKITAEDARKYQWLVAQTRRKKYVQKRSLLIATAITIGQVIVILLRSDLTFSLFLMISFIFVMSYIGAHIGTTILWKRNEEKYNNW